MGEGHIWWCDVCGERRALEDDVSEWHRVHIGPLEDPVPALPGFPGEGAPPEVAPPSPYRTAIVCHKPSCLTKWVQPPKAKKG